jgi:hypothetical protein
MPIHHAPLHRVSQKALELYVRARQLEAMGAEYVNVDVELHRALGLRPWHESVLWIDVDAEPPPAENPMQRDAHALVVELRRQLEALVAPPSPRKAPSRRRSRPRVKRRRVLPWPPSLEPKASRCNFLVLPGS